jgi:5'-nucleotidase
MRILLTNDDGVHAAGLKLLERIASQFSYDVWIVAPETDQSGVAHSFSLSSPLRLREIAPKHFAVQGTPTDCVLMAVRRILGDKKPDLVLSGVNRGQNVAEDVTVSGTVAGAIEGMVLGVPAIALSQSITHFHDEVEIHYETAETFAPGIVRKLIETGWAKDVVINLNFPSRTPDKVTEVEVTRQGFRDVQTRFLERRTDLRGRDYYWIGYRALPSKPDDGTDLRAIYDGRISVTPLHIDLTHMKTVHDLKAVLGGAPPKP